MAGARLQKETEETDNYVGESVSTSLREKERSDRLEDEVQGQENMERNYKTVGFYRPVNSCIYIITES